jgi:hypothetical protein
VTRSIQANRRDDEESVDGRRAHGRYRYRPSRVVFEELKSLKDE